MIEVGKTYQGKDIGQVLAELAEGGKWKKCVVNVVTNSPGGRGRPLVYSALKIVKFEKSGKRFDLCLEPEHIGPLSWGQRDFFWPGKQDEDGGGRKPIIELTIVGWKQKKKRKRGKR